MRRPQSDTRVRGQASLELPRQAASALGDSPPPDPHVQVERRRERPAVLERVEAAWGHQWAGRPVRRGVAVHPGHVRPPVEARDRRLEPAPGRRPSPEQPRPARAEEPLVATGREQVAAELDRRRLLHAERMHPIRAEQYALPLGPIPVRRMHDGGDLVEGELHPRRRVDPRHSEAASSRGQRTSDRVDDAPARRRGRIVVEADESNRGAASGRRRPERDMGGVEIVLRRDDLVAGTQAQPAIHQPKTHRRAVGQRDLVR